VADADLLAYALAQGRPRLDAVAVAGTARLEAAPDPAAAERCAEALRALRALRREVLPLPLADLVAEVIERTGLLAYFALQHRGEQRVANLHKAVDIARRIEAAGRRDLPSFMRWMENLLDAEPEESDSPYLEGEGDAVRVTTVHRAKGLEYPIVMLGGIIGGRAPDYGLQVLRREDGGVELKIPGKRGTSAWRSAQELEDARSQAEEKRLLYVALPARAMRSSCRTCARDRVPRGYSALFRQLYEVGQAGPGLDGVRDLPASELPTPPTAAGPHRIDLAAVLEAAPVEAFAAPTTAPPAVPLRPTLSAVSVRPSIGDSTGAGLDGAERRGSARARPAAEQRGARADRRDAARRNARAPRRAQRGRTPAGDRSRDPLPLLGARGRARAAAALWIEAPLAVRLEATSRPARSSSMVSSISRFRRLAAGSSSTTSTRVRPRVPRRGAGRSDAVVLRCTVGGDADRRCARRGCSTSTTACGAVALQKADPCHETSVSSPHSLRR
jgi:hypothetical protein